MARLRCRRVFLCGAYLCWVYKGAKYPRVRKPTILKHFVALSGGPDARIAVIPTASSLGQEVVDVYDALFIMCASGITKVSP